MDELVEAPPAALLAPISPDRPAGEDLAYSALFDDIREARRADDPGLAQGEWASSLKVAEWSKVRDLCEQALGGRSKDLRLAVWYAEALTRQRGFAGAATALSVVAGLLKSYWETMYPALDPADLDERAGRLEWLNTQLGQVLRQIPLTAPQHGGYDWYRWQESREVDNLGLRDADLRERALAEGRLSGEAFDRSARSSGIAWFRRLSAEVAAARGAYDALDAAVGACFGSAAPSLGEIREALDACGDVAQRLVERIWGRQASEAAPATGITPDALVPAAESPPLRIGSGIAERAQAIRQLHEVARYFRAHEPHSPVALLVERAARWAEMPLEDWLQAVIKDDSTLRQLRELLDIPRD